MKKQLRRLSLLSVLLVVVGVAGPSAQAALSASDRQLEIARQKAELSAKIKQADVQVASLISQINASDARRAGLETQIRDQSARLADAEQRLQQAEAALGVARVDLIEIEGNLSRLLDRVDMMHEAFNQRARRSYQMNSGGVYIEMLLSARGFSDLVNRAKFIVKVMSEDRSRLDGLTKLSVQMDQSRQEAVQKKTAITSQRDAVDTEKAHIASLRAQLQDSRRQVVAEIANRKQLLTKVQADKASYLKQMAALEAESRSIAAMLRARQKGQVYQAGSGKKLAWPTTGSVTSPFGWRTSPIFGDRRFHYGIDIGAPYGQPVIASESGQVVSASTMSGYGLAVIIDHGGALATLYAHLSAASVTAGQRISRGQQVGLVGCSGWCTGPHLHFEVRINGEPKDPMLFF
jgi:murein DD-endopeptidase MepM/ murein hydrolase activator NlpD